MPQLPSSHPRKLLPKNMEGYFLDEIERQSDLNKFEFDQYDYSPAMDLLHARQKIACLDSILASERNRHAIKQNEFRERWKAAATQLKSTDEAIVHLDKHYQESLEEKDRFLQITARQDELYALKYKDISRLGKETALLRDVLQVCRERLSKYLVVEGYLEGVREMSQGEFQTIKELINRFNLLKETRDNLVERDNVANMRIERSNSKFNVLNTMKGNEAVLLHNLVVELADEVNALVTKEQELEQELKRLKTTASKRSNNLSRVRLAAYNLYRQACQLMGKYPESRPTDTIKQLNYIQGSLIEINKLRKQLHQTLKHTLRKQKREADNAAKLQKANQRPEPGRRKTINQQNEPFGIRRKETDLHGQDGVDFPRRVRQFESGHGHHALDSGKSHHQHHQQQRGRSLHHERSLGRVKSTPHTIRGKSKILGQHVNELTGPQSRAFTNNVHQVQAKASVHPHTQHH